jgi:hypothetical protein
MAMALLLRHVGRDERAAPVPRWPGRLNLDNLDAGGCEMQLASRPHDALDASGC